MNETVQQYQHATKLNNSTFHVHLYSQAAEITTRSNCKKKINKFGGGGDICMGNKIMQLYGHYSQKGKEKSKKEKAVLNAIIKGLTQFLYEILNSSAA